LLKRLVLLGHQWFLYSDRPLTPRFPIGDRVQLRVGKASPGSALSLLYSQAVFPRWARGDCVDIFWSPRHHLPLALPARVVGVVTVHDLVWKRYPETMQRRNQLLERWLMGPSLKRAERIISVSNFTASEIAAIYPEVAGRCTVISEAAEPFGKRYEERYPLPAEPYLLFVGTPEPRKNLSLLLAAYARAVNEHALPQQLLIVGADGWGGLNLADSIERLQLQGRVLLKGRVSDAELHDLYAGSTGLLMPSLYEGFGLPALEAMQHGVPVIAGDCGALPELVGDSGLLVDPYSEEQLTAAIARLCSDSTLRRSLSAAAQERAAGFNWERAAQETLHCLEQVYQLRQRELEPLT
jgi:glycosyltransferase involved in cell wall biosynthesis